MDVAAAGKYETDVDASWAQGDFNADGRFDSDDLIDALADGGYEMGPRATVTTVPEASSASLLLIGLAGMLTARQRIGRVDD